MESKVTPGEGQSHVRLTRHKTWNIWIGDVCKDASETDISLAFSSAGAVSKVRLIRDKVTQLNKGYGFVHFADREGMRTALRKDFQPPMVKGRQIRVGPCQERVNMFVGNIPTGLDCDGLLTYLIEWCGPDAVASVDIKTHPDGTSRGFGFVQFVDQFTALRCLKLLEQYAVIGVRHLNITPSDPEADDPMAMTQKVVYMANLDPALNEEMVQEECANYGTVTKVQLIRDPATNQLKGICFVEFETRLEALKCVAALHNAKIGKTEVQASIAKFKGQNYPGQQTPQNHGMNNGYQGGMWKNEPMRPNRPYGHSTSQHHGGMHQMSNSGPVISPPDMDNSMRPNNRNNMNNMNTMRRNMDVNVAEMSGRTPMNHDNTGSHRDYMGQWNQNIATHDIGNQSMNRGPMLMTNNLNNSQAISNPSMPNPDWTNNNNGIIGNTQWSQSRGGLNGPTTNNNTYDGNNQSLWNDNNTRYNQRNGQTNWNNQAAPTQGGWGSLKLETNNWNNTGSIWGHPNAQVTNTAWPTSGTTNNHQGNWNDKNSVPSTVNWATSNPSMTNQNQNANQNTQSSQSAAIWGTNQYPTNNTWGNTSAAVPNQMDDMTWNNDNIMTLNPQEPVGTMRGDQLWGSQESQGNSQGWGYTHDGKRNSITQRPANQQKPARRYTPY